MTHAGYVLTAWGLVFGTGAAYSVYLVRRGRALAAKVPPARRRWMATGSEAAVDE